MHCNDLVQGGDSNVQGRQPAGDGLQKEGIMATSLITADDMIKLAVSHTVTLPQLWMVGGRMMVAGCFVQAYCFDTGA